MNTFRKSLLVAATALSLGSIAVAAPAPDVQGQSGWSQQHDAKMAQRIAKRQAALHDKLALTPAQESAWATFTAKLQSAAPVRPAKSATPLTAPERADRMVTILQTAQQNATVRAQAVKEFYAALSPAQQKTFDSQFRGHRHHFGHHSG